MIVAEAKEIREHAFRWLEEGQNQHLGVMLRILQDYDRFRERAETAERESEELKALVYEVERLRNRVETSDHECDQLREEVKELRAGHERHQREREEIADALTRVMNEAIMRLRTQPA